MFTKVERIDDAQGPAGGSQLKKNTSQRRINNVDQHMFMLYVAKVVQLCMLLLVLAISISWVYNIYDQRTTT